MFENLSERLSGVFDKLTKQGALSEDDVKTALREVRVALLEADVSLPVARDFVKAVAEKATGQQVTKSVTPGQQVVKVVHDELQHVLAGDNETPGELTVLPKNRRSKRLDRVKQWVELGAKAADAAAYEGFEDSPLSSGAKAAPAKAGK